MRKVEMRGMGIKKKEAVSLYMFVFDSREKKKREEKERRKKKEELTNRRRSMNQIIDNPRAQKPTNNGNKPHTTNKSRSGFGVHLSKKENKKSTLTNKSLSKKSTKKKTFFDILLV